jgi:hypothetical protein
MDEIWWRGVITRSALVRRDEDHIVVAPPGSEIVFYRVTE